ncbi:restriction endonuclease subunit S [Sphaerimonospora sp. CA-214678]|uniref:restriction endonuclease subunit S n=1 Tax=Sphaerimonospora sp. CA-214678 TaxID=3240029 RepID=UPI003D8DA65E
MAEWPLVRFEELAAKEKSSFSKPYGSAYTKEDYVSTGVPLVRGVNLGAGRFHDDDFVFITPEKADSLPGANLTPGDLVITHRGTIGQVSMIPRSPKHERYVLSTSQVKARLDASRALPEFYYYWLLSPAGQREILQHVSTVGVPGLVQPVATVKSFKVPHPPLGEQQAVATVLSTLDDKIAVNERIAATSRELGLALFAQALLDEDPLETAVESIVSTLTRGVTPKYSESPDDLIVLNQKCVRDGRVNLKPSRLTLREKVKVPKLLQANDVLVNSTGVGTLGRVARWTCDIDATVDSHIAIVRFDPTKVDPVCAGFAMLRAQTEIEALGEGSTGQTELSRAQLGALEIALPNPDRQHELREKLDSLEEQADQAMAESAVLAALRDTLLPQLMSGRLRIRDAEKIVEDVI